MWNVSIKTDHIKLNFEQGLTVLCKCEKKSKSPLIKVFTDEHQDFKIISIKLLTRCVIVCGPQQWG